MSTQIIKTTSTIKTQCNAITKLDRRIRTDALEIAVRLACIKALPGGTIEAEGYKNIAELAADKWGYAKATTYKFIQCAERFITETGRTTQLASDDGDYSIGQLIELLPLDDEGINDLIHNGEITPDMTTKQIRKVVKDYLTVDETSDETSGETSFNDEPDDLVESNNPYSVLFRALATAKAYADENGDGDASDDFDTMTEMLRKVVELADYVD